MGGHRRLSAATGRPVAAGQSLRRARAPYLRLLAQLRADALGRLGVQAAPQQQRQGAQQEAHARHHRARRSWLGAQRAGRAGRRLSVSCARDPADAPALRRRLAGRKEQRRSQGLAGARRRDLGPPPPRSAGSLPEGVHPAVPAPGPPVRGPRGEEGREEAGSALPARPTHPEPPRSRSLKGRLHRLALPSCCLSEQGQQGGGRKISWQTSTKRIPGPWTASVRQVAMPWGAGEGPLAAVRKMRVREAWFFGTPALATC